MADIFQTTNKPIWQTQNQSTIQNPGAGVGLNTKKEPPIPTGGTMVKKEVPQNLLDQFNTIKTSAENLTAPTTLSNVKKNEDVNNNIKKLQEITDKRGIRTDVNGVKYYPDGSLYPEDPYQQYNNYKNAGGTADMTTWENQGRPIKESATKTTGTTTTTTGETPLITADVSTEDASTQALLDSMKESTDASTKEMIDLIQKNFENRRLEQKEINARSLAGTQNALLMGGVTGAGSSAQYAPISSGNIITAQENYGIKQIADLDAQEAELIATAKAAQATQNYKLMETKLKQIEETRKQKIDATTELNKKIIEQNQKVREANLQSQKENAITELYGQGITDVSSIMASLKAKGITITSKEVSDIVKNIKPDNSQIQLLAGKVAEKGADQKTIQAILSSPDYNTALLNSGNWLSQMNPTEKLDYQLKLADLAYKQKQTFLLGQPTPAEKKATEEALKNAKSSVPIIQDKIDLIDILKTSPGMAERVGPNALSRISPVTNKGLTGLPGNIIGGIKNILAHPINEITGKGQDFVNGIHRLTTGLSLQALIDAKQQGATFGALSDAEMRILSNSATSINDAEIKDDKGLPTGVWNMKESSFKNELDRIKKLLQKSLEKSQETIISPEEQSVLDNIYETSDTSSFYGE